MYDGHFNECKKCAKKRVTAHRNKNIEAVREYDRNRPNRVQRTEDVKKRRLALKVNDPQKFKEQESRKQIWRDNNPEKYRAHNILNNAVRDGKVKKPYKCEACGKRRVLHGHHDDYSKPLDVDWLCSQCHNDHHKELG